MGKRNRAKASPAVAVDEFAGIEREFRAALAKLTGGIAPQDYGAAWAEWCLGLVKSPARQAALGKLALDNALDLWMFTTQATRPPLISW